MLALYLFCLILGGGFLSLAVFGDLFGGHADVDGDLGGIDGHLELDAGGLDVDAGGLDLDAGGLDVDAGGMDLDAGGMDLDAGHMDVATAHAHLQADAGSLATKIFSIRNLFYSMFGFGAMGTLLTITWSGNPLSTAAVAVLSGMASGAIVNSAFNYLWRTESGQVQAEVTYAGLAGKVTLPIRPGVPGKVVVERSGRRVELRALPRLRPSAGRSLDVATSTRD